jgi:hypothetical protein
MIFEPPILGLKSEAFPALFVNKQIMKLLLKTYFERNHFPSYSIANYSSEKQNYIKKVNYVMINQDIENNIKIPEHIVSLTIGQTLLDCDYRLSKKFDTKKNVIVFTSNLAPLNLTELNFYQYSSDMTCLLTDDSLKNLSRLKNLVVPYGFNQKITEKFFPNSLTDLDLGHNFNYPLLPGYLPDNLLNLRMKYNHTLTRELLPNKLISLKLFREKKCDPGIFPESLQRLELYGYNHDLEQDFFPSNLKDLYLFEFDSIIKIRSLPKNLTSLKMCFFKQILHPGVLPESLLTLHMHHYNHPLEPGIFPNSLLKLRLGFYDQPLNTGIFPSGLLSLKFLHGFNQVLKPGVFPQKLKTLFLGYKFNHQIEEDVLPKSLQRLQFGECFDQMPYFLDTQKLPNLSSLYLYYAYRHQINFDELQNLSMIFFQKRSFLIINKESVTIMKSLDSKKDTNDSEYEWKFYTCMYGNLMWKRKSHRPVLEEISLE